MLHEAHFQREDIYLSNVLTLWAAVLFSSDGGLGCWGTTPSFRSKQKQLSVSMLVNVGSSSPSFWSCFGLLTWLMTPHPVSLHLIFCGIGGDEIPFSLWGESYSPFPHPHTHAAHEQSPPSCQAFRFIFGCHFIPTPQLEGCLNVTVLAASPQLVRCDRARSSESLC